MIKDYIIKGVIFGVGFIAGVVVTNKVVDEKYRKLAEEEIESVREVYKSKEKREKEIDEEVEVMASENKELFNNSIKKAMRIIKTSGYDVDTYDTDKDNEYDNKRKEAPDMSQPYVISPNELGESDYPIMTLMYHVPDGIVSNDDDKIVSNVEELIGSDFHTHFGEYEEDSVYVRNDEMEIDYEILKVYDAYSEDN